MIKRTTAKTEEKHVNTIISRKTVDLAIGFGVAIESSAYVHGEYDWIMTFTAENILLAKKFCDSLVALYPDFIEKMTIM